MCEDYTPVKEKPLSEVELFKSAIKNLALSSEMPLVGRNSLKVEIKDHIEQGLNNKS